MKKMMLLAVAVFTFGISQAIFAAVLSDDAATFALWHCDTITSNVTPDSNDSGRLVNNLTTNKGTAAITLTTGEYGQSLNFGTNGRQEADPSQSWPLDASTGRGQEFRVDGWFYIPNVAALPIPTTAGGSGAPVVYAVEVSTSAAAAIVWYMQIQPTTNTPSTGIGTAYLIAQNQASGKYARVPLYSYNMVGGTINGTLNRTGKWLHVTAFSQYSATPVPSDPNYNRIQMSVDDFVNPTATTYTTGTTPLGGSGTSVFIGNVSGKSGCTPYRGWRGRMDELKISVLANVPRKATLPNPANGSSGYTYSPTLQWVPGPDAMRSEVYFGTSQADVTAAIKLKADINADGKVDLADVNDLVSQWLGAPAMPCPDLNYDKIVNFVDFAMMAADYNNVSTPLFLGSTTGSNFDPNELQPNTTYYWRVDSADCNEVLPGTVWSFSTASAKAATPSPANNAMGVDYHGVTLSWAEGFAGSSYNVYFGTSADSLTLLGTTALNTIQAPSGMQANTQYYWRVDTGAVTGDVWTFKTGVIAFPGAEGFGAMASGGLGGTVYHVTNLNNSGAGSLRDAVSVSGRTVVFDVGGVITITSPISVVDNITIAGQTAPGGIVVYGNELSLSSRHNIIVRYLSVRQGINGGSGDKAFNMTTSYNIMVDHVSVTWGRWDTIGISDNAHDITMQNCIMGESIAPQNFGGFIDSSRRLTIARNLFLDNESRNPKGKGDLQYFNNVIYNWGGNGYCGGHSSAPWYEDLINNYFIAGPSSSTGSFLTQFTANDVVYNSGNYADVDKVAGSGMPAGRLVVASDFKGNNSGDAPTFLSSAHNAPPIATSIMSAANAYSYVVSCVGNSLNRDGVDQRLINQVKSLGTLGAVIDTEVTVGGQTAIVGGTAPTDTDGDGMPDFWETAMGLNPAVADNNGDADGDGYTNLNQYLNWLGGPHAQVTLGGYIDVDLQPFTSGFTSTATYTITDATSGTAVILGDGHTARFTSTGSTTGLGSFSYTVDDGRSMTGTVQVLVQ